MSLHKQSRVNLMQSVPIFFDLLQITGHQSLGSEKVENETLEDYISTENVDSMCDNALMIMEMVRNGQQHLTSDRATLLVDFCSD